MATQFLSLLLTLVVYHSALVHGAEYNYHTADTTYGPNAWPILYPQSCNGTRQSPIDIQTSETSFDSLGALTFTGYDAVLSGATFRAKNSGLSFWAYFTPNMFQVSGGGLIGTYYTHNFHFHWGSDSSKGSEHRVDGKQYPAEMHIVNINTKYSNVSEALKMSDGVAVIGVLLQVGDENPALASFLKYTANVTIPSSPGIENLTMTDTLASLLPPNTPEFYRYSGSLTTPICGEVATWTIFKNPANISVNQLNMLRSLKESDKTTNIENTFRPIQALNSRVVKTSFMIPTTVPTTSASRVTNTMATIVSVVMIMIPCGML